MAKRNGKQFCRSLRTTDHVLAKRRLADFRQKISHLSLHERAKNLTFGEPASRWLEIVPGNMKASSAERRETSIQHLKRFLDAKRIRNITEADCDE